MTAQVRIDRRASIDRISPDVYGHFAEHLGRCIYGGIWDDDGDVETTDGIRTDTVSLLRELDVPVLRWPGGCFADDYHWEDGVGPREERPRRRNLWWTQDRENVPEEPNAFGTDEFVHLCRLMDAEPYIALNVGSSDPQETIDWIEYCNYDGDTELAERRRANDNDEPHGVTYWGIGNENWGCGGRYTAAEYADAYRRFANYLAGFDRLMNPGSTEFIACGHITEDWNRDFFERLADGMEFGPGDFLGMGSPYELLDHFSVHRYYQAGDDVDFDDEQYYRLFARARKVADDVDRAVETIAEYVPRDELGIIVDEWGVWHPQSRPDNGLEQENTVRDALTAASVFDTLHDRADVVSMANIAQTVNVLQCMVQTDAEEAWPTPTYHVFDLYGEHRGRTAVETSVEAETLSFEDEAFDVPLASASASVSENDLFVTASNRRLDEPTDVRIDVGYDDLSVASARVLFEGLDAWTHSTKENADRFTPAEIAVSPTGEGTYTVEAPPTSVVAVRFSL